MGYLLKQSDTTRPLVFLMISSSDHISGVTEISPTVTLSKNGAAFNAPSGAVTEIGSGWYKVAGNATDTSTVGPLLLHATGSGADPCDDRFEVVAFDPGDVMRMGMTAIPNVVHSITGGLPTSIDNSNTVNSNITQINSVPASVSGTVDSNIVEVLGIPVTSTTLDVNVVAVDADGQQNIRDAMKLAPSDGDPYAGSIDDDLEIILTTLESDPYSEGSYRFTSDALYNAPSGGGGTINAQAVRDAMKLAPSAGAEAVGSIDYYEKAIKSKTDNLPASPAAVGSNMGSITSVSAGGITSSSFAAGSINSTVAPNLDIAVSTRMAPTVAGRTLDVTATGAAGIDWGNIENPTTVVNLTGTTFSTGQTVTITDVTTLNLIADTLLKRDFTAITGESARSALNSLRKLMNKIALAGNVLTVYKENDSSVAYTQTVVTSATALPIISADTN